MATRMSLKVGRGLRCQALLATASCSVGLSWTAERVVRENSASRQGEVRPLALGLDAEMGTGLLERDLQLPTLDEPAHDLIRRAMEVGAQQGLRGEP